MPYVSARIEELVGLRPEELAIDMSEAYALIHPVDAARMQESISQSVRTLSPWHAEFRIRHPEKGEIWLEGHSIPEPKQDGASLWYGFLHEITERKQIDESLRAKQEQLATMSVELSLTEERERRRISSVLHDHIGQTLLLSRIKLGTLADVFVSGSDEKTYGEIQSLLDQTIRDIRSLTQQLNPPMLASLGIEAALEWLARRMEADYSLLVDFAADRNEKQLTEELSSVVYQSARELLINVTKHSGTSKARLTVSRDADMLVLAVEDQGIGFACLPDAGTNLPLDCSFGLFNIRQRIKLLGGSIMIESTPGKGTRATIRVPVVAGR
jgi:PAS domain S-box-containing protein